MPYTNSWNESSPLGSAQASTIDDIIRSLKLDVRERVGGIFGLSASQFAADPIAPISLSLSGNMTAVNFFGFLTGNSTGTHTGAVTGNATTASALQVARTINGVSFDGSANIVVTVDASTLTGSTLATGVTTSSLTSVGSLTGLVVSGSSNLNDVALNSTKKLFLDGGSDTYMWESSANNIQIIAGNTTVLAIAASGITMAGGTTISGNLTGTASSASTVPASGLTGTTLPAGVTASSLTSVGALSGLIVSGSGAIVDVSTSSNTSTFMLVSINALANRTLIGADSSGVGFVGSFTNTPFTIRQNNVEVIRVSGTAGQMVNFNGTGAAGAYIRWTDVTTVPTPRGYVGYGSSVFTGGAITDFGIISENGDLVFATSAGAIRARISNSTGVVNSTAGFQIGTGATISKWFKLLFTWDPASITTHSTGTVNQTVTGAVVGDLCLISPKNATGTDGLFVFDAYVSAADTVTVRAHNLSTGSVDLPSDDYMLWVVRLA